MKAYTCRVCEAALYFENSRCVSCGSNLGYARAERAIVPIEADGVYQSGDGLSWRICANLGLNGCTWLTNDAHEECSSCRLTRMRPSDNDSIALAQYRIAERAKRHLLVELDTLGLSFASREQDPEHGLTFDLLSSVEENVVIGHDNGAITIDLAESDDAHREKVRAQLDEPYRTMLGHFRHEIGHFFEQLLVRGELIEEARELFGDESVDYQEAIDRHYAEGPPIGWEREYISSYATMHPFEDFAETFAHYLHICDTIDTARSFGLLTVAPPTSFGSFRDVVVGVWVPLSISLNQINRSMGREPLYPFVIPSRVIDKLELVARLRDTAAAS